MKDKNFKIVDSFLFSEPYEKELLLLKLQLEDRGIDEWLILENAYTLQGEKKGFHARKVLASDERFVPYLHKITIIEKEFETKLLPKHVIMDEFSFKAEHAQRDFGYEYFINRYSEQDWILISDVDEMMDFTDENRYNELISKMKLSQEGLLKVPTKRYWHDFDNEYQVLIGNAVCNKKYLVMNNKKLSQVRFENRCILRKGWKNIIQFEYSSCFDKEFILRKFYTSTHTGLGPEDMEKSLLYNHRPVSPAYINKVRKDKKFFFETVKLTEYNSPAIVRDNLNKYKTHSLDKHYQKNRKAAYPEAFSIKLHLITFLSDQIVFLKKKFRFLMRRLGTEKFIYK